MIESLTSDNPEAPILVIYGSNPYTRDAVLRQISKIGDIIAYGTLDEEEGNAKMKELSRVDIVIIGKAYDFEQRERIHHFINTNNPNAKIIDALPEEFADEKNIIDKVKETLKII